ncbi:hypothetical protein [Secundilactobacillus kimchicus]|uniref:Uncharacterized protein n=1 Tax=Secundilactobacillus kimchicus JCM 15530 TaxID=1302272 RepID=A0A0R1HQG1_9LACO|nr:hypothetical protein [Secundilactobacillus kimchicus]KRK49086.1 hypothetical protein FC96_GL000001 [Secundilactobacillus kimchicus JCM 15530]MBT9671431.1 hypothetical protein [Secundilactobacillus kimchicus]
MQYHDPTIDLLVDCFMKIPVKADPYLKPKGYVDISLTIQNATMQDSLTLVNQDISKAKGYLVREGTCAFKVVYHGIGLQAIHGFKINNGRYTSKYTYGYDHGVRLASRDEFLSHLESAIKHTFPVRQGAFVFPELLF